MTECSHCRGDFFRVSESDMGFLENEEGLQVPNNPATIYFFRKETWKITSPRASEHTKIRVSPLSLLCLSLPNGAEVMEGAWCSASTLQCDIALHPKPEKGLRRAGWKPP